MVGRAVARNLRAMDVASWIVEKQPDANTVAVVDSILAKLPTLRAQIPEARRDVAGNWWALATRLRVPVVVAGNADESFDLDGHEPAP